MALSDKVQQLEEQITTAVQRALAGLREELDQRLELGTQALKEHLAGLEATLPPLPSREELERIAGEPDSGGRNEALSELRDGLAAIDRAASQSEILLALLRQAGRYASRAVLLLTRDEAAFGWGSHGFEPGPPAIESLRLRYEEFPAWTLLREGRGAVQLSAAECARMASRLDSPVAEEAILVPLILRDRLAAAIYADRLAGRDSLDVAALQSVTYVAAQALELRAFRERQRTPTLQLAEDATAAAPLPLWSSAPAPAEPVEAGEDFYPPGEEIYPPAEEEDIAAPPPAAAAAPAPGEPPAAAADAEADADADADALEEDLLFAPEEDLDLAEAAFQAEEVGFTAAEDLPEVAAAFDDEPAFDLEAEESSSLFAPEVVPADASADLSAEDDTATDLSRAVPEPPPAEAAGDLAADGESLSPLPEELLETPAAGPAPTAPARAGFAPPPQPSSTEELAVLGFDSPEEVAVEGQPLTRVPAAPPEIDVSEDATVLLPRTQPVPPPAPPSPPSPLPASPAPAGATPEVQAPRGMEGPGLAFSPQTAEAPAGREESRGHEEGRRLARLLVSEIRLYNEEDVEEGRRNRDIYSRLQEEIDRSRKMYEERIPAEVRADRDYFTEELVRILADGDSGALGM